MFNFLALLTNKAYWSWHSWIIRMILRLRGIKVGTGFYIEGVPKLKIRGKAGNINIGNQVMILGNIDLRNRENGKIIIEDGVKVENDCRFVSAREGTIHIKPNSVIGAFGVFNCAVYGFVHFLCSSPA